MADPSIPANGFHVPLNVVATESCIGLPLPNAWNGLGPPIPVNTRHEFAMLHFVSEITDKVHWDKNVFNDEIVSEWKSEALSAEGMDITREMADQCIDDLRDKAKILHETGTVVVYDSIIKSDSAVPSSLQQALQAAVKPLEDVPDHMKDWHPNSDEKVLNLVHPSLFPLIYGVSRVLPYGVTTIEDCIQRCGEGEIVPASREEDAHLDRWSFGPSHFSLKDPYSRKFQWLPCEVDISGEHAKIMSYINNLHPQRHPDLYDIIAQVITHAIPLWNLTIAPLLEYPGYFSHITSNKCTYDPYPESWPDTEGPQQEKVKDEDVYYDRREERVPEAEGVVLPKPDMFISQKEKIRVDLKGKFGSRGLQVIVKLANIELTPEKPMYEGGMWHVEGQMNEHICATALYYYASENIASSSLAFQQHTYDHPVNTQYDPDSAEWPVFGEDPAVQVGRVASRSGRLIALPNMLQYRVEPFRLADTTCPGRRKVLALFLVDPHVRVLSTADVPPQQRAWWHDAIALGGGLFAERLPAEIRDQIVADVDGFPLTLSEAKRLRLELMEERKQFMARCDAPWQGF